MVLSLVGVNRANSCARDLLQRYQPILSLTLQSFELLLDFLNCISIASLYRATTLRLPAAVSLPLSAQLDWVAFVLTSQMPKQTIRTNLFCGNIDYVCYSCCVDI